MFKKRFFSFLLLAVAIVVMNSGCATKINSAQKFELESYKAKGLYVEEKSTGAATGLGLLPGGGSFYTENYGIGVANLLLWPLSILWDPVSGYWGAEMINFHATKQGVEKAKKHELTMLDRKLEDRAIERDLYISEKRKIEDKYNTAL